MSEQAMDEVTAPAFDRHALIPAVVQDARSRAVLMLGYMNRAAYEKTLADGEVWFYSRSRARLWKKGETSGNVLRLRSLRLDCDGDTILVQAEPAGPTCHTGRPSCFFNVIRNGEDGPDLNRASSELFEVIKQRLEHRPDGSYVAKLADGGVDRIAKKIGEEATEVVIAAMKGDQQELTREMADLWFHSYLVLANAGLAPEDVWAELARRRR